jgi:hypothetical protein
VARNVHDERHIVLDQHDRDARRLRLPRANSPSLRATCPHALANHSDAPARYLLTRTPAGFERHWARIAAEQAGVEPPQWALQPIPEVTIVGPQIAAQACSAGTSRRDVIDRR